MGSEYGITEDTKPELVWDGVSIFWIALSSTWTFLVASGMIFLYVHREMPLLRIRGLPLSFAAVIFLHLYLCTVQQVYMIGPIMPEQVEFWCMSIYLPFGIALFQASNTQFLHVAKAQKSFVVPGRTVPGKLARREAAAHKGFFGRIAALEYQKRVMVYVGAGMAVQLFISVLMFLISRKFHPEFGIPGTEVTGTPMEQKVQQGRGWEWWPSIVWQFIWAWIIAPIILWKSRGIHDTLGWRLQTVGCCLAGLHATPMWLIALYVPAMAPINKYFAPPHWVLLWIMVLEFFTIFVPVYQVLRHRSLRQETLESIAAWENKKPTGGDAQSGSFFSGSTKLSRHKSDAWKSLTSVEKGQPTTLEGATAGSVLTMNALESVLEKNPEPLRQFSALRDFSGENIAFLTSVTEWKAAYANLQAREDAPADAVLREQFNRGLRVYVDFVSPRQAEFSINLASRELNGLEVYFENAARILYGDREDANMITPFDGFDWSRGPGGAGRTATAGGESNNAVPLSPRSQQSDKPSMSGKSGDERLVEAISGRAYYWGPIPEGFGPEVFDMAEKSIKYLVLTNTWPKFVKERRYSLDSLDSEITIQSYASDTTIKKAVRYVRSITSAW